MRETIEAPDEPFQTLYTIQKMTQNKSSPRCKIFNIDVHRASYAKDLACKKRLGNEKKIKDYIDSLTTKQKIWNPETLKK